MNIQGEITEKDFLRAQWLHMKPRRSFRIAAYVVVSLFVIFLIVLLYGSISSGDFQPMFVVLLPLVLLVGAMAILRRRLLQIYRNQPSLQGSHSYVFNDDGIKTESPLGRGEVSWSAFTKWREDAHVVLLYQADNLVQPIPKRWFDDASVSVDELHTLLQTHSIQFVD